MSMLEMLFEETTMSVRNGGDLVFLWSETDTDQLALKSREEGVEDKCLTSHKKCETHKML